MINSNDTSLSLYGVNDINSWIKVDSIKNMNNRLMSDNCQYNIYI